MVLPGIDAGGEHHNIEKGLLRQFNAASAVVIAGMEMQLVNAATVILPLQHRRITAAVVVGDNAIEQLHLSPFNAIQLNFQFAAWATMGGIQYVCGQSSHRLWAPAQISLRRRRTSSTFIEFGRFIRLSSLG